MQDKNSIERGLFDEELVPEELTQVPHGTGRTRPFNGGVRRVLDLTFVSDSAPVQPGVVRLVDAQRPVLQDLLALMSLTRNVANNSAYASLPASSSDAKENLFVGLYQSVIVGALNSEYVDFRAIRLRGSRPDNVFR